MRANFSIQLYSIFVTVLLEGLSLLSVFLRFIIFFDQNFFESVLSNTNLLFVFVSITHERCQKKKRKCTRTYNYIRVITIQ